jgi:hypothetical protein
MGAMKFIKMVPVLYLCLALFASDYQIKTVPVLPLESYPARTTVGSVGVAADPYSTDDRSYTAFDIKNLNSRGYFPIHVIIQNNSADFLTIRTQNVVLVTRSGQQLYTTPASMVVEDVVKPGKENRPQNSGGAGQTSSGKKGSPLFDFTNKELTNRLIDPGTVSSGFLFFFTSRPRSNPLIGGTLYIPKLEQEGTSKALGPFSIPLDPGILPSQK